MSEKFYVVSESELEDLTSFIEFSESWRKARAACRSRPVMVVAVDPATEVPIGWELKK